MNPQLDLMIGQAVQAFQSGNLSGAEAMLSRVLKVQPKSLPALHILGLINAAQGNHEEAAKFLKRAVQLNSNDPSLHYNLAKALSASGREQEALPHHQKVATLDPNNIEAWHNYARSLTNVGQLQNAIAALDRALSLQPNSIETLLNKVYILKLLKRYEDALTVLDLVLQAIPLDFEVLLNKGGILQALGRDEDAVEVYKKILAVKPDQVMALINMGIARIALKQYDEALASLNQAQVLEPTNPTIFFNIGLALYGLERFLEALETYDKALAIKRDFIDAWYSRSTALASFKRYEDAIESCDEGLKLDPTHPGLLTNRGAALFALKEYERALKMYDRALSNAPNYADAWFNKGVVLAELKAYDFALGAYEKALEINPKHHQAWFNKGVALGELKIYDEALKAYEKSIQINNESDYLFGLILGTSMLIGDWNELPTLIMESTKKIESGLKALTPFTYQAIATNNASSLACAKIWTEDKFPLALTLGGIPKRQKNDKIKIGYFSSDFRDHPVSVLTIGMFESHDRNRFEVFGFAHGAPSQGEMHDRLAQAFDQYIDIREMSDIEVAALVRDLEIDIAIDLNGHTRDARTSIFANRAAPVQINYLGYPGTMGCDYMDYIIADEVVIPENNRKWYSEKVVYLPNSFMPNDINRPISSKVFARKDFGLPDDGFIFCCFNNGYKYNPEILDSWVRILNAVPNSVLWTTENNSLFKKNIQAQFEQRGIDAQRVIFATRIDDPAEHLARHQLADLFLDTTPYNAHTTACDALWAGLPLITRLGETFPGRVAASLLSALGLPELITNSEVEYESLAIQLANNKSALQLIREKLKQNRDMSPLFKTEQYTDNIERAYIKMHDDYVSGKSPQAFKV
jgi:predicted O-linked N-acetylglucosamine transferase (SPINDLY family)